VSSHDPVTEEASPSEWVLRFGGVLAPSASVLDLACGSGRHARWFAERGHRVLAVDVNDTMLQSLAGWPGITTLHADLEHAPWPLPGRQFQIVVVTRYLYRPLLETIVDAVAEGGLLIYETFARGNEKFGRPSNPAFLLDPGELLDVVRGRLRVLAYEDLLIERPRAAMIQRICARREGMDLSA
jgi:SAM-dependent methyltransferase